MSLDQPAPGETFPCDPATVLYLVNRCRELEAERDHWHERFTEANNAYRAYENNTGKTLRAQAERVIELERDVVLKTLPGSYLIRAPGVYVAQADPEHGPGINLTVTKYLLADAVVLTANPGQVADQWWHLYRDDSTGALTAWKPTGNLHNLMVAMAQTYRDPSERPWMGTDPGKPGDDRTSEALREEIVSMRPQGDPEVDHSITGRLSRLEAWARQFDNARVHRLIIDEKSAISELRATRALDIKPLDEVQP